MKSQNVVTLDRLDRKLLNELQKDAGRSNKELATVVGTSPASCLRRIRRLKEAGIIASEIAIIEPLKTGRRVLAITTIQLRGHQVKEREDLVRLINSLHWITQCYMITGGEDMLILADLESLEDFEDVIARKLSDCPIVAKITTSIAYKTIKFAPYIQFEDESWDELPAHASTR